MSKTALVAGATGLIGQHLVSRLLSGGAYTRIRVLARRPLSLEDSRIETLITDYSDLSSLDLQADDVYCCLGTTLKTAGSKQAFEKVDYGMVMDLARAARKQGARQFLVVSAAGTSETSPSFYSRVKAKMEREVSMLDYEAVHILRPSLLLGTRAESRPAEHLSQVIMPLFSPLLFGPLKRYRAVKAEDVAEAMLLLALREQRGIHIHHLPLDQ
jgi:uncharacterized protein YbjT (DUF2867 family)